MNSSQHNVGMKAILVLLALAGCTVQVSDPGQDPDTETYLGSGDTTHSEHGSVCTPVFNQPGVYRCQFPDLDQRIYLVHPGEQTISPPVDTGFGPTKPKVEGSIPSGEATKGK